MTPTPIRTVRVPDELWQAAKDRAGAEGVSAVIVRLLAEYVQAAGSPTKNLVN